MEKQPLVFDKEVQIVLKALDMLLTFPHAVLLRHERVACHCFMSFGLCDKNGTASCGYKSQPCHSRGKLV